MSPVWSPRLPPPVLQRTSGLSPDGEMVWQALLCRHQKKQQAEEERLKTVDHQNYYQTLYQRCFGTPQSVRNFELTSPLCSQMSSTHSTNTDARNLHEISSTGLSPTPGSIGVQGPNFHDSDHPVLGCQNHRKKAGTSLSEDSQCEPNSLSASNQRFDYQHQFGSPLHSEAGTMVSSPSPEHFTFVHGVKKVPAALSGVFDLHLSLAAPIRVTALQASREVKGCSRKQPDTDFNLCDSTLASQAGCQEHMPVESLYMNPSQSLFSQPGSSSYGEVQGQSQAEQRRCPSPPLDLSPENETYHLLTQQSPRQCHYNRATDILQQQGITVEETAKGRSENVERCVDLDAIKPSKVMVTCDELQLPGDQTLKNWDAGSQRSERSMHCTGGSGVSITVGQCALRSKEWHQGSPFDEQDLEANPEKVKSNEEVKVTVATCPAPPAIPYQESTHDVETMVLGSCATSSGWEKVAPDTGKGTGYPKSYKSGTIKQGHTDLIEKHNDATSLVTKTAKELQSELLNEKGQVLPLAKPSTRVPKPRKRTQQTLEAVLKLGSDRTVVAQAKRPKKNPFSTPFKSSNDLGDTRRPTVATENFTSECLAIYINQASSMTATSSVSSGTQSQLKKVWLLSDSEREQLVQDVTQAEEVALTLTYNDGSSQLRELPETKKRKSNSSSPKVTGLAIAYPRTSADGESSLLFAAFPVAFELQTGVYKDWCRKTLTEFMSSGTRKLCFDGQELIQALLDSFHYDHTVVSCQWQIIDLRIAGWLLDPDNPPATFRHLLMPFQSLKQVVDPDFEDQLCGDLALLGPAMLQLYAKLSAQNLWSLYIDVEMKLVPMLAAMENRSIWIDQQTMTKSCTLLEKRLRKLESLAHQGVGHRFVLSSHAQLRQVLFGELRLDGKMPHSSKIARTLVNQEKSTSEAVLTQLQDLHPLPGIVLQYRQVKKLKSTYVDGMMAFVYDGQLRTHWDHTAATTGRLTSSNPNIQTIPKQPLTLDGYKMEPVDIYAREPFTSREGCSLLAADFQQIELRLLAHFSQDKSLLDVFSDPDCQDIFNELTSQWLEKSTKSVTQQEREQTKRVVYSIMYGAGKERLAEYLKISSEEARCIIQSFLGTFPGVNSYSKSCVEKAKCSGYQSTLLHRRRWFPHINHPNNHLRAQAERQAVNFCIQGSAADLCKVAMIQVEYALAKHADLHAQLLFQIHDELLIELPDEEMQQVAEIVQGIMESAEGLCGEKAQLRVPLKVSLSVGKSWGHMEAYTCTTTVEAAQQPTETTSSCSP